MTQLAEDTGSGGRASPDRGGRHEAVKLSIVVPCLNEDGNLPLLYREVAAQADGAVEEWELILVDDGSTDRTLGMCRELACTDPRVRYVSLTRNFGKESALIAGLAAASGDAVIIMDADLQHPPQLIPELVKAYLEGHDQVVTRRSRAGDPPMRKMVSRGYYTMVNRLADVRIHDGTGDFRLLSRRAVSALLSLREQNRFSKGLFSWIGFDGPVLEYVDNRRTKGSSRWGFRQLVNYGVDGVVAFNVKPLRMLVYVGLTVMALSLAYSTVLVSRVIFRGVDAPGYVTLITAVMGLGGLQLVGLGVLGEYVGRIYLEVKRRPHFLVADTNVGTPDRVGG
jgi:glycosyltransferase involved in cell wall biosynthesis